MGKYTTVFNIGQTQAPIGVFEAPAQYGPIYCLSTEYPPENPKFELRLYTQPGRVHPRQTWADFLREYSQNNLKDIFCRRRYDQYEGCYAAIFSPKSTLLFKMDIYDTKLSTFCDSIPEILDKINALFEPDGILAKTQRWRSELDEIHEADCLSPGKKLLGIALLNHQIDCLQGSEGDLWPFLVRGEDIARGIDILRQEEQEEDPEQKALSEDEGSEGSSCTGHCNPGEFHHCG